MSYSNTIITASGYTVSLPTAAVAAFLSLPHDEQVELAEVLNMPVDEIDEINDPVDVRDELINDMVLDLEVQDQAIDAFMDDRDELIASNDSLNEILLNVSRYVGQLREMLLNVGIVVKTDNTTGTPILLVS